MKTRTSLKTLLNIGNSSKVPLKMLANKTVMCLTSKNKKNF